MSSWPLSPSRPRTASRSCTRPADRADGHHTEKSTAGSAAARNGLRPERGRAPGHPAAGGGRQPGQDEPGSRSASTASNTPRPRRRTSPPLRHQLRDNRHGSGTKSTPPQRSSRQNAAPRDQLAKRSATTLEGDGEHTTTVLHQKLAARATAATTSGSRWPSRRCVAACRSTRRVSGHPPHPREVARWITTAPSRRGLHAAEGLRRLLKHCPELRAASFSRSDRLDGDSSGCSGGDVHGQRRKRAGTASR
jgi:hypothetical protein